MRLVLKLLVVMSVSVPLVAGARAVITRTGAASGPYHAILDRNIFGLIHPEDLVQTNEPPAPPPNVNLIGLLDVSGRPQGVFAVSDPGPGPRVPTNYIMGAEDRQQGVDVLAVDIVAKTAKVQIGENVVTLKLIEPKPITTGSALGTAAAPPGARPPGYPPPRPGFLTTPSGNNTQYNGSVPGASAPPAAADSGSIPNRQVRSDAQQAEVSADQQMYNIEMQRAAAKQANSPIADLLPPTPLTESFQQMMNSQPNSDSSTQSQATSPGTTTPGQQTPALGTRVTGKYLLPGSGR